MDVSIIVPCYKVGSYLPSFVQSLKSQDYKGTWEAIFIDDGDPDAGSVYALVNDPHFRLIHQENRGLSAARNAGLSTAQGTYILFADPDDEIGPHWISTLVTALTDVDLVWGAFEVETEGQCVLHISSDVGCEYHGAAVVRRVARATFGYQLHDLLGLFLPGGIWRQTKREFVGLWSRGYRREIIGDLRFDEQVGLYEDAIFMMAYAQRAQSMRVIGETGYRYVIRPTGLMTRESKARLVEHKFELRDARYRLDPGFKFWRGTFLLSAVQIWRLSGFAMAKRYWTFKPFSEK